MCEIKNKKESNKIILYGLDVWDYHHEIYGIFSTKEKLMKAAEYLGYSNNSILYNIVEMVVDPLDIHFDKNMNYYSIHIDKEGNITGMREYKYIPGDDYDDFGFSFDNNLYCSFWALNEEQAKEEMKRFRLFILEKNLWSWEAFNEVEKERNISRKQHMKEIFDEFMMKSDKNV